MRRCRPVAVDCSCTFDSNSTDTAGIADRTAANTVECTDSHTF